MLKTKSVTGLGHFSRLNQAVFLHQPSIAKTRTSQGPDLILILGWMDAQPRHIAKYTAGYEELYPCARILAITTSSVDAAFRTTSANLNRVKPALEILYTLPADAKLLVHFFSNGGAVTNTLISKAYAEKTGRPLPVSAQIFDSTVGRASYEATVRAFSLGLPKNIIAHLLSVFILRMLLGLYILGNLLLGKEDLVEAARRALNDKTLLDLDTPRLYIYSVADDMVAWQDVEEHAKDAKRLGYTVYMEKYQDSGHAAHMLVDAERYWGAVDRLWHTVS
ncbi:Transmembrane protein [Lachnellula subtilissima]|uniref:Transmembrane protein n=1 Tax=Lachnellula subtilissima TaxID=602034 RepID=A0A8H8RW92_9HELO|nr:Transmembrane protein [Lachnellula subtilissima]